MSKSVFIATLPCPYSNNTQTTHTYYTTHAYCTIHNTHYSGWSSDGVLKLFDFGLSVSVRAQRERTEQYRFVVC